MPTIRRTSKLVLLATALVSAAAACSSSEASEAGVTHQTAEVSWHPQQESLGNTGTVEGASANLIRHGDGVAYQFHARDLTPGNAYTLWVITVDNPDACAGTPCTGPEFFDPGIDAGAQVFFGTGQVVGSNGQATFAGHIDEGALEGWLPDRALDDATTAEFQFTLNDHGPALSEHMPGMIQTYRGGCSDDSPFPEVFPDTALADGDTGPNECRLAQGVAFPPE